MWIVIGCNDLFNIKVDINLIDCEIGSLLVIFCCYVEIEWVGCNL